MLLNLKARDCKRGLRSKTRTAGGNVVIDVNSARFVRAAQVVNNLATLGTFFTNREVFVRFERLVHDIVKLHGVCLASTLEAARQACEGKT